MSAITPSFSAADSSPALSFDPVLLLQAQGVRVVALLRMPSILVPGEYDNRLYFRNVMTLDADEKFNKKSAVNMKIVLSPQNDVFMVDSDGTGHTGAIDNALTPAL